MSTDPGFLASFHGPHWTPPGGTSTTQYREISDQFNAAFLAKLRERVAADPRMWIKVFDEHSSPMPSVYVGWNDDRRGGYYVSFGMEHERRRTPEQLRSFNWLGYSHEDASGEFDRQDRVGESWFEAPYAQDIELQLDLLFAWLDAHRRTLTTIEATS
jgi:hypothetical protein